MNSTHTPKTYQMNGEVLDWMDSIRSNANFEVNEISLSQVHGWVLDKGIIHHRTGRFFNIVGVKFTKLNGKVIYQPLIEQREIGTLGFIWRHIGVQPELLIQAKIEPGNIGIVQIAPSCQATESNIDRIHGGDVPPYSNLFKKNELDIMSKSFQSEQGNRFLGKLNCNIVASFKENSVYPTSHVHRWLPVDEVLKMLTVDYLLNTDARSVLVCSDWKKLVGRDPFTLENSKLSKEFSISYLNEGLFKTLDQIKNGINKLREQIIPAQVIPLTELPDYRVNDHGVFPKKIKPFFVKYISVKTAYREVRCWDQPIIESYGKGKVDLICAKIDGVLHFLFKPIIDPGLLNKVELGPSDIIEPGDEKDVNQKIRKKEKILIESWQSDEGGRFYQDRTFYRIIDSGLAYPVPEGWMWLTLKQVSCLLREGNWLTNEARSALSLILPFL